MKLHGFFRSSAAQRVRIALNLKGVKATPVSHHLPKGEHKAEGYVALNPQGLVPSLELDDGTILTQSLAIIEWLDETHPTSAISSRRSSSSGEGSRLRAGDRLRDPPGAEPWNAEPASKGEPP